MLPVFQDVFDFSQQVVPMSKIHNAGLVSIIFIFASHSAANAVTLTPTTPPAPTTFATVNGVIGLDSEALTGGEITLSTDFDQQPATLGSSGNFSLAVAADSPYQVNAILSLDGMPDVAVSTSSYPALVEGEINTLGLTQASGRLVARVNAVGGTVQRLFINAAAINTDINGITQQYSFFGSADRVNNMDPEVTGALPAAVPVSVSGQVQIAYANGCTRSVDLETISTTLSDRSLNTNASPDPVEWNIDVTDVACTGAITGEFRLDGLDLSAVTLTSHQLSFFGEEFFNHQMTGFGSYFLGPVLGGMYTVSQSSSFDEPYSYLSFGSENNVAVGPLTRYNAIHSVGTSHGNLQLSGDWTLNDTSSVNITASGTPPGSTQSTMSANDIVDLTTGVFDFVLAVGNWDTSRYGFQFESQLNGRTSGQSLNLNFLPDTVVPVYSIAEGQVVNVAPVALETASAQVQLDVAQESGQTVTINQLSISGSSELVNASTQGVIGNSFISASSDGTDETSFLITLHGLPGTYNMNASGTGSDGRLYAASFQLTFGGTTPEPAPEPPPEPTPTPEPPPGPGPDDNNGSMACYAINKVKLHRHHMENKDSLFIKYAAFSLPEDAVVDLAQDDVSITIDGKVYEFPAGSFKHNGDGMHYMYKTGSGVKPQIQASIDLAKFKWSLKLIHINSEYIDNSDGIDIALSIGDYHASENVHLESKNKFRNMLMYKRKPKASCGLSTHDDGDESDDKDRHDHGEKDTHDRDGKDVHDKKDKHGRDHDGRDHDAEKDNYKGKKK